MATVADLLGPFKEPNEKIAAKDEEYVMVKLKKQERQAENITKVGEDQTIVIDSDCPIIRHNIENMLQIAKGQSNDKSFHISFERPLYEDCSPQKSSDRSTIYKGAAAWHSFKNVFGTTKLAFTGSVVEHSQVPHTDVVEITTFKSIGSHPSKSVSKFKMQKSGRQ